MIDSIDRNGRNTRCENRIDVVESFGKLLLVCHASNPRNLWFGRRFRVAKSSLKPYQTSQPGWQTSKCVSIGGCSRRGRPVSWPQRDPRGGGWGGLRGVGRAGDRSRLVVLACRWSPRQGLSRGRCRGPHVEFANECTIGFAFVYRGCTMPTPHNGCAVKTI